MVVKPIPNAEAWKEAIAGDKLVVLDCYAEWCGPCKMISPVLEKLSESTPEANFYKLDVDEVPDLAQELGIKAMPTFIFFKNGEKLNQVVGAMPGPLTAAVQAGITA